MKNIFGINCPPMNWWSQFSGVPSGLGDVPKGQNDFKAVEIIPRVAGLIAHQ